MKKLEISLDGGTWKIEMKGNIPDICAILMMAMEENPDIKTIIDLVSQNYERAKEEVKKFNKINPNLN